jgi:hypothetical protein
MRTLTLTALSVVLLLGFVEAATTPAGAVPLGNIATSSDPPPTRARSILEKVGWRDGYGYGYYGGPRYYYGNYYPSYRYSYGSYYPSYRYSNGSYCPPYGYYPSYGYYGGRRW